MLAENKLEEKLDDATNKESVDEKPKAAVKEVGDDENISALEDVEESPQSVVSAVIKPYKVKHSASTDSGNPIFITIPIYVNSGSGLPVTLSISGQQVPLKAYRQGIASRWDTTRKEASPTSLYNKLL
ncbi:uncharacterized protein LOC128861925 [Anastrepha ludens]|uniref:uncharacterized protein LOC128861925 n=1 Tax=Anastrepha ludens TaxID=28586 RepID=UPI0023AF1B2A|nr:uncharacterized protein LOC128861925 [Anastrepha ludens]